MSTGKFREKEIAPNPEENARLSGVAHGGTWREDGQGVEESVAQTRLDVGAEYVPKPPQLSTENESGKTKSRTAAANFFV